MAIGDPRARFEITADDKTAAAFNQVNTRLQGMEKGFASLASAARLVPFAAAATAIVNFSKAAFEAADAVGDAAAKFGTTAESLSRLKFAAAQSDVEFSSLTVGIKTVQKAISEAANGSDEATKKFSQLGLSASELRNLPLEQQFKLIAQAFKDVNNPADQTRVAMELFGKAGADLVPLLNQGAAGIDKLMRKADELGITLNNTTAAGIDAADKALKKFNATASGFTANFLGNALLDLGIVELTEPVDILQGKLRELELQRKRLLLPGVGLFTDSALLPGVEAEIDRAKQKLLDLQRLINGGAAVASGPNSRNFRFNEAEPKQQTASELAAIKSANELRLKEEQLFLDAKFFANQAVNEALFQAQVDGAALFNTIEADKTDLVIQGETERLQQLQSFANSRMQIAYQELADVRAIEQQKQTYRNQFASLAIQGLAQFGQKSKGFAIAAIALNRGIAIADIGMSIAKANAKAVSLGPWGWAMIAANVALGVAEIANVNKAASSVGVGGGSPVSLGSAVNPVFTQQNGSDGTTQGATQQRTVTINFNGAVLSSTETSQWLIDTLREAVQDRDVVFIPNDSRQAQELMPT